MSQPVETEPNGSTETEEGQATEANDDRGIDWYKSELAKVRSEAAARRVALREQEEKAKKWSEYEESQKTELQKLQDQLAERDRAIAAKELEVTRARIAKQYNVADDDLDLLVGDEANMKRLAERLGKKEESNNPPNLYAGGRGKPVGSSSNGFSMEDVIRGLANK